MLIAFPIGGIGKRFKDAGYKVAKPFLPIKTKALIEHVMDCYPKEATKIVVIRREYLDDFSKALPDLKCHLYIIEEKTRGPVDTLLSLPHLRSRLYSEDELLIADCDSLIDSTELSDALATFRATGASGGVTIRKTTDAGCSYADIDSDFWVRETREKDPFTPYSTTGPYWWKHGADFVEAASTAQKHGQHSVSPCYNYLIGKWKAVKAVEVNSFKHLGTPEDYEKAIGVATVALAD